MGPCNCSNSSPATKVCPRGLTVMSMSSMRATPTAGAFQTTLPLPANPPAQLPTSAFVAKLNSAGSGAVWATYLGGTGNDQAQTIAIDPKGDVWVSGTTASPDFPFSAGAVRGGAYLAEFDPSGSSLVDARFFPAASALAIDRAGVIHAATGDLIATLTPGGKGAPTVIGIQNAAGGWSPNRISPGEVISIYGLNLAGSVKLTIDRTPLTSPPLPILYTSDTQIIAVAPFSIWDADTAVLHLTIDGVALPGIPLYVYSALPSVFAGVLNQDGTANSKDNPAQIGSMISIWATGVGSTGTDGRIAPGPLDLHCCVIHDLTQNQDIVPAYGGMHPGWSRASFK